jgi:hypothetical protein
LARASAGEDAIFPCCFGFIQLFVGFLQPFFHAAAWFPLAQADADPQPAGRASIQPADPQPIYCPAEPVSQNTSIFKLGVWQNQEELITSHPHQQIVLPDHGPQNPRHLLKNLITPGMPQGIIYLL